MERPNKGKSLIDFPSDYIVLDLETTGFDTRYDKIIEICMLEVKDNIIVSTFNKLINPGIEIDEYVQELTGITNEMLKDAPSISDLSNEILEILGNNIIIGHNISFDVNFLYDNLDGKVTNDVIDTLRISRKLLPDLNHHRLIDLVNYYNISKNGFHRAKLDCDYTFALYNIFKENISDKEAFINSFNKISHNKLHASDIISVNTEFDEEHPFFGKNFVFTGTLDTCKRSDAMQLVVDKGGNCQDNITKHTNYLVLGNNDYCSSIKDGKSNKQKKAEQLLLSGADISIISENVFFDMLN